MRLKLGLVMALAIFILAGCGSKEVKLNDYAAQLTPEKRLNTGNWDPFNWAQLNKMLALYGDANPAYNKD